MRLPHRCPPPEANYRTTILYFSSSRIPSPFSPQCEVDLSLGCLLSLLDESVQQDHAIAFQTEQDTRDSTTAKIAANLPKFAPDRSNQGHPDGPRKLHVLDVLAYRFPIFPGQAFEPLSHWLSTIVRPVETRRQALTRRTQTIS